MGSSGRVHLVSWCFQPFKLHFWFLRYEHSPCLCKSIWLGLIESGIDCDHLLYCLFFLIISVFNVVVHLLVRCCSIDYLVFCLVLNAWRDLFRVILD